MPLIITYKNGQKEAVAGESIRCFYESSIAGKVITQTLGGHDYSILKDDVRNVEVFPLEQWNKQIEEQKKREEEKQAAQAAEAEAARKAQVEANEAAKKARRAQAAAKKPLARVKRFLHLT